MRCSKCGKEYSANERDRPSMYPTCPDCFIEYLEVKVGYLEKHLKLAKRILKIKLIQKQEEVNEKCGKE